MRRKLRKHNKKLRTSRLVRVALRRWDTDAGWRATAELQMRGSPQTLQLVKELANSLSWRKRSLGMYIASQLRKRENATSTEYAIDETQLFLLAGLCDGHDEVIRAAISGMGHRPHPNALNALIEFASHHSSLVRWNVAVALGSYNVAPAIGALLTLMQDPDSAVRDWATFGIGSLQTADTPDIREALWRNLDDSDDDVSGEALVGLAERRDCRVVDYLRMRLSPDSRVYELDAAEILADPELLSMLQSIEVSLKEKEKAGILAYAAP